MNFKKIGQITSVMNATCFHAIPKRALVVTVAYRTIHLARGKKKYETDLNFWNQNVLLKTIHFDANGVLEKFKNLDAILFRTSDSLYEIHPTTFEVKERKADALITAQIGDRILVNNQILKDFKTNEALNFEAFLHCDPNYNNYYPANALAGYVPSYSKTTSEPNRFNDAEGTFISGYSLKTGKGAWEYSFTPLPSEPAGDSQAFRFHFIGNNLTQLWLLVANGQIVILDIQTGKELKRLGLPKAIKPSNSVDQAFQTLGRNYLEDKKWVALSKHHYLEVNTTSFKAKYVDMSVEFDKYDISCMFPCFDKKYIYFYDSSWMGSRARGKIAVLDRKSLKIIWCWDMLQEIGTAPLHMEIIENQLFILDNALTLHLFE